MIFGMSYMADIRTSVLYGDYLCDDCEDVGAYKTCRVFQSHVLQRI